MSNLTLSIDAELLKRARIRALEQGTSVNSLVRDYLDAYTGGSRGHEAMRAFLDQASGSEARSDGSGFDRDELYEERLDRYGRVR